MANRIVFFDDNENELDFHVNKDGDLYIQVGQRDEEGGPYNGYIVLDIEDVEKLIDALMEKKEEMSIVIQDLLRDREESDDQEQSDDDTDDELTVEAKGNH